MTDETQLQRFKKKLPFRLGTTSYILAADIQKNVKFLADKVDDIEVVLFESDTYSNFPDKETITVMQQMQQQYGLSYTIHFPLDCFPGSSDPVCRQRSVTQYHRIIECMEAVNPFGYVLHLPIDDTGNWSIASDVALPKDWNSNVCDSIDKLLTTGVEPSRICVETLSYPFELAWPVVEEKKLSVCLDIGHVLLNRYDLNAYYKSYFHRVKIIHLHGIIEQRDHCDISVLPQNVLNELFQRTGAHADVSRVVTLEIFNEKDFVKSIETLEEAVQ